ncbi:hypothetical protein [Anianabacter salinae]|uniref:hypothetical protein n=1 Tax=Anianabacter salinae TaxID=2851023 RepID=UPI00225E583C|nr:hypothetical protein [Anianabacter salinae]MBV0911130.1 hypothetical protein [Anianabacter salinae]
MKSVIRIRQSSGTRLAYSEQFLMGELLEEASHASDPDFSAFQVDTLRGLNRTFDADAMSVVHCTLDANQMIASIARMAFHSMAENELDAYRRVQHLDVTRPAIFRNVGTAVFNTDFRPLDAWQKTDIFRDYYLPLGMLHTASLAYAVQNLARARLQITYFKKIGRQFDASLHKDEVEFLSIPFFIAWSFRCGLIDHVTCKRWLRLLIGRTPTQLFLLRAMASMPRYSIDVLADRFGLGARMVNHHFAEVYDSILPELEAPYEVPGNASRMVDLAQAFGFLRLAGDYRARP